MTTTSSKYFLKAFFVTLYIFIITSIIFYIKRCIYNNTNQYPVSTYIENFVKSYIYGDTSYITNMFNTTSSFKYNRIKDKDISKIDINKDLQIGGLNEEVKEIIDRVLLTRDKKYLEMCNDLNFKHVKGIILYGPPGTGKTLIARKLSENILMCDSFKIVSGPELLDKWVGSSEKNVRDLFIEAEAGTDNELHVIVFDEIDALCKKRNLLTDTTGSHSNIVNTLLTKMDGLKSLNNILLIGTTNRLDTIDPAFLRPGRFELKLHIKEPDREGRKEIFEIHLRNVLKHFKLMCDVSELADLTPSFTGAQIEGLVRKVVSKKMLTEERNLFVNDFEEALEY